MRGLRQCGAVLLCLLVTACASQQRLAPEQIAASSKPVSRPITVALLGGTGMVGGHILQRALARGYALRVLTRSPQKLAYLGDRITLVSGDARDPRVINRLLNGSDVVISAIGPGRGGPPNLTTTVSRHVVAAMGKHNITRYLLVSGAGVVTPGEKRSLTGWFIRQLARVRYPALLRDRQQEYRLLAASDINWTIARCPLIASGEAGQAAEISLQSPQRLRLRAGALADFLLDQIADPGYVRRAPFVFGGLP